MDGRGLVKGTVFTCSGGRRTGWRGGRMLSDGTKMERRHCGMDRQEDEGKIGKEGSYIRERTEEIGMAVIDRPKYY